MNRETWLTHAGSVTDPMTGAVVPPLYAATTFQRDDQYHLPSEHVYARYGHPLATQVEATLAGLDGGGEALIFNSGLSAMAALLDTVPTGSNIAIPRVMYHGGRDLVHRREQQGLLRVVTFESTSAESLQQAMQAEPVDLVWVETMSNPTWDVTDVDAVADVAREGEARLAVDSTVTPPVTFRPLEHGADYVFHSATKYLNGHSDVTAGALVARDSDERWVDAAEVRKLAGSILPPFETWLLLRGLRTLHLRFERSSSNAQLVAEHLDGHDAVEAVSYPGLANHPGHEVARRLFDGGFGGMVSFHVAGDAEAAIRVATRLNVIKPATSLGGVESLIEHRASVEGTGSPVAPNLLRLSIGIENPDDLVADLDQALA